MGCSAPQWTWDSWDVKKSHLLYFWPRTGPWCPSCSHLSTPITLFCRDLLCLSLRSSLNEIIPFQVIIYPHDLLASITLQPSKDVRHHLKLCSSGSFKCSSCLPSVQLQQSVQEFPWCLSLVCSQHMTCPTECIYMASVLEDWIRSRNPVWLVTRSCHLMFIGACVTDSEDELDDHRRPKSHTSKDEHAVLWI